MVNHTGSQVFAIFIQAWQRHNAQREAKIDVNFAILLLLYL